MLVTVVAAATVAASWLPQSRDTTARAAPFMQLDRHGTGAARVAALCAPFSALSVARLERLQDSVYALMYSRRTDADFRTFGCVRAMLAVRNVPSQAGGGVSVGESRAHAAMTALSDALSHQHDDVTAAELLGVFLQEWWGKSPPAAPDPWGESAQFNANLADGFATGIYRAARTGQPTPGLLRSCTSIMIDIGDRDMAHQCSILALAHGADSAWHLTRLAYLAYTRGDTTAGNAFLAAAFDAARDSASRSDLGWHLEPAAGKDVLVAGLIDPGSRGTPRPIDLLSSQERDAWSTLPASSLRAWLDSAVDRRRGEAQTEGYDRLHRLAPDHLTAIWKAASPFTRNAIAHFWYTSYAGGVFRGCDRDLDTLSCMPKVVNDELDHFTMAATSLRFWRNNGELVQLFPYLASWKFGAPDTAAVISVTRWMLGGATHDTVFRQRRDPVGPGFVGLLVAPYLPSTGWALSAVASIRRGTVYSDDDEPIGRGTALSDIAMSAEDNAMHWFNGADTVWFTPVAVFRRSVNLVVYCQLRYLASATQAKVRFTVRRVEGADSTKTQSSIEAAIGVQSGITPIVRSLDLSRLQRGTYEIELAVTVGGAEVKRMVRVVVV